MSAWSTLASSLAVAGAFVAAGCGGESASESGSAAPPGGHAGSHAVSHLQEELGDLGYYEGPHDGVFGDETQDALEQLQADEGLESTGELDRSTRAVLGALAGKSDALSVKAMQTALAELGLYDGLIDGDYGPATEAAIEEVQREAGIEVDGAYGQETAAALNAVKKGPQPRIEVDLDRQIAFVVSRNRRVAILKVSTGSGETYDVPGGGTAVAYTPTGRFTVYRRVDGIVEAPLGSPYKPLYFDEGWAVHGAASVPGYPASHGCVRTSDHDQDFVSRTLSKGSSVFVYGKSLGEPGQGRPGF